jgi:hypothetical protein
MYVGEYKWIDAGYGSMLMSISDNPFFAENSPLDSSTAKCILLLYQGQYLSINEPAFPNTFNLFFLSIF